MSGAILWLSEVLGPRWSLCSQCTSVHGLPWVAGGIVSSRGQQLGCRVPLWPEGTSLPEPPQGAFGSDQILSSLGAAFYLNYRSVKLDVFKTYQVEITASPNFLSKCFAFSSVKRSLASGSVVASISIWRSFHWGRTKLRCSLWTSEPSGLCDQLHQINPHPDPSEYFSIVLVSFSDHDQYVDKNMLLVTSFLWLPSAHRALIATFGTHSCLCFAWSLPDVSPGPAQLAPSPADHVCAFRGAVSSPLPPHPGLGRWPSLFPWAWPRAAASDLCRDVRSCHQQFLVIGTLGKEWGQPVQLLQNLTLHRYPKDCLEKFYIGPWCEWEVTTEETIDLNLDGVCRNWEGSRVVLFSVGGAAARAGDISL